MGDNFLKPNEAKTEFIRFGLTGDLENVSKWTASVGDEEDNMKHWSNVRLGPHHGIIYK